jgi:flagellar motor switch protein FliG
MKSIPRERVDNVLQMFSSVAATTSRRSANTDAYVRSVLKKALGEDKANILLDRILASDEVDGIDNLRWMDTRRSPS